MLPSKNPFDKLNNNPIQHQNNLGLQRIIDDLVRLNKSKDNPLLTPTLHRRSIRSQSSHDRIVSLLADHYSNRFYVKADIKNWDTPTTIKFHRPDLILQKNRHRILVEVETGDSLGQKHSINQIKEFINTGNMTVLIVPEESYNDLYKVTDKLNTVQQKNLFIGWVNPLNLQSYIPFY